MLESQLQKKSIEMLNGAGWYVIRTIAGSKAGILDLNCCDPFGRFVGIELKVGYNKLSKLQKVNAELITKCNGFAYVVYNINQLKGIIEYHKKEDITISYIPELKEKTDYSVQEKL